MSFNLSFIASLFCRPEGLHLFPLLSFCLVVLFALPQVHSQCYFPNTTLNSHPDYQPCPPVIQGSVSMCCATNRTTDPETCLPNGLCGGRGGKDAGDNVEDLYWRESCTDKSWKSTYCLKLCTTPGQSIRSPMSYWCS